MVCMWFVCGNFDVFPKLSYLTSTEVFGKEVLWRRSEEWHGFLAQGRSISRRTVSSFVAV